MKQTLKKSVSILLSLIMVFSLFTIVPITASAESEVYLTDFLPVSSSGTATGYSTYANHFYKIEWSGINTSETSSVQLYIGNNSYAQQRLRCYRNNENAMVVLYASASDSIWELSHITNLAPGQSSSGYTSYAKLGKGASNTSIPHVYKKVCTVTCMAANTPTWNWSDDFTACTATFTCSANSSLTATVNADVTTSGNTATASVTFNGTSYTDTKSHYNITYVLNGGTNASDNPSTYVDDVGVSSFAAPTREHYTFGGWYDNENCTGTPVTSIPAGSSGDRTLYAKWTINSYTVTWKNSDGSTLKTEQVNYGETPVYSGATPVKPATAQYTYFFFGWSPEISAVTGDQTYTAQFSSTFTKYKVTWKDADGTVLETDNNVSYGTTPVYNGATPAKPSDDKYSYSFKGWNPSVSSVTGDVTYTATYTKTPNPNHFSQDGDTYTIYTDDGWDIFCDCLQDNDAYNRFTGKTVELADDITVTRMAGGSNHDFKGIFDGQRHTLTVAYGTADSPVSDDDKAAPFRNVESGCVIKNLHTQGTIYTSRKYAGGIVGTQYGTVKLENCRSSVTINSMTAGDGTHGGLVGHNGSSSSAKLTIDGCVFDGKLLSVGDEPTTNCAGFVGYKSNNATFTITNSLYAPKALEADETEPAGNSATFVRNGSAGANCYYTRTLGTAQGKQPYTITAGDDVTLGLSGKATEYGVSGITAYAGSNGIKYGETTLYAGSEDTVTLTVAPSVVGYAVNSVSVNDGFVAVTSNENGTYSFTMPDSNVAVTAELEEASYFDESTGTLTLKGTLHKNTYDIVLPDGVNKYDVQHINVDSSGATLPQDSARLFYNFTNVTSIDLTGADTRNVTKMNYMFYCCENLTELDLSSFDTGNVRDMNYMFFSCENLTELDLSSFDTGNVTNMSYMFDCCNNLTELDLSSFDTSFVNYMTGMFSGCGHLTELNLSSFDTSSVSDMNNMFFGCFLLKTIYVSEQWRTESVDYSNDMFENCRSLKGGNDTAYDGTKTDKTYAVIDKDGQPGYLTGVYTLTLPDHMEIATDASPNMKVGNKYLSGAVVTVRYTGAAPPEHYRLVVKANGTELTDDGNGVYTIAITDSSVTVTAEFELITSWTSGDCTVTYDPETHTMTVTGSGAMANYSQSNPAPWASYNDSVTSVVISDGVTGIGSYAFYNFSALTSLSMADTVTSIGEAAFLGCGSLKDITIPASVTSIGRIAFNSISQDATVTFVRPVSQSTLTIGYWAFNDDAALYYSGDSKYALFDESEEIELTGVPNPDYDCILNGKNLTWKLPVYAVKVASANGTVTASVNGEEITEAYRKETVLLTVTPDEGYRFKSITATVQKEYAEGLSDLVALMGDAVFEQQYDYDGRTCKTENGKFAVFVGETVVAELSESNIENYHIDSGNFGNYYVNAETDDESWSFGIRHGNIVDVEVYSTSDGSIFDSKDGSQSTGTLPQTAFALTTVEEGAQYSFTMPDKEVTVTAEFTYADGVGASVIGHSISLEGDIAVNFYMELDSEIAQSDTAYMLFTIPNGSKTETKTVFVKDAREDGGYYIFKCSVAAKDMNSVITAQILGVNKETTVYTYSVKDYADWLIKHKNDSEAYTKAAPLVEKMLRYGAYAKEYFDKTDTLPDLDNVNIDSKFATYTSTVSDDLFDGATLSLKSQTTLSLYFTDEDELTFTCVDENGAKRTVETVRNGSTQIARIRNIAAKELQDDFTLTVKKGETVLGAITYSPMNYCYKALNGGTENENLINAVKALVAYSDAANEFFKAGA